MTLITFTSSVYSLYLINKLNKKMNIKPKKINLKNDLKTKQLY